MSFLAARKQLLIAESELNRQQMAETADRWIADVVQLTERAKSITTVASVGVAAMTGLSCLFRRTPAGPPRPTSRLQTILKATGLVLSLWRTFQKQSGGQTTVTEETRTQI